MQNANNPRSHDEASARVEGLKVDLSPVYSSPGTQRRRGCRAGMPRPGRSKTEFIRALILKNFVFHENSAFFMILHGFFLLRDFFMMVRVRTSIWVET